jgi:hypothetical protein
MFQHISTPRRRFAADGTTAPGAPQAGPTYNDVPQGQCFADIAGGVAQSLTDNFSGFAGALAGGLAGGSFGGMVGAAATGLINATVAGIDAAKNSPACQTLDNSTLANELGVGAIVAP